MANFDGFYFFDVLYVSFIFDAELKYHNIATSQNIKLAKMETSFFHTRKQEYVLALDYRIDAWKV